MACTSWAPSTAVKTRSANASTAASEVVCSIVVIAAPCPVMSSRVDGDDRASRASQSGRSPVAGGRHLPFRPMRYGVLGPVEVGPDDGPAVAVTSPSQRTVLAVLLARANQVVPIDELVVASWRDRPPTTAVHSLRTYVSRLRSLTGPAIAGR